MMLNAQKSIDVSYKIFWYLEKDLIKLTRGQRTTLASIIMLLSILALAGNVLTIIVIVKRKQRPLFRVCVISLALSDILYILFTSTYYMAQFMKTYTSLWSLGSTMCCLIPFVQSLTVVANSFTLVMIAFDRYLAVTNVIKEKWQPGLIHSIIICAFIWIFAALIASGALWNYKCFVVYIIILPPQSGFPGFKTYMCSSEKQVNRKYYTLVFTCVFAPTTAVFIFLNSIIAKRIWDRRKFLNKNTEKNKHRKVCDTNGNQFIKKSKNTQTGTTSLNGNYRKVTTISGIVQFQSYNPSISTVPSRSIHDLRTNSSKNLRKAQHIRMFKVVFAIISIFLLCRLPSWSFLLIKMYSSNSSLNEFWIMHYSFGILVILNCSLNPLIYTFLSTTLNIWEHIRIFLKLCCRPCMSCHFIGDLNPITESITEQTDGPGLYRQKTHCKISE
uniref:CSON009784 protein n=1 Tax=Culicoides sonorensis TaxID=179676 RepID=A0A336MCW2_CULSO